MKEEDIFKLDNECEDAHLFEDSADFSKYLNSTKHKKLIESLKMKGAFKGKIWTNALEATRDVKDGATFMAGGFGLCGIPENCIKAIAKHGPKKLTVISNEMGTDDYGLSVLITRDQVRKVWASYIGECKIF